MSDDEIAAQIDAATQAGYAQGYAAAKRDCLLKASDAMNDIVNHAYTKHRAYLETWANELGRPLHTAVPGHEVFPRNYQPTK